MTSKGRLIIIPLIQSKKLENVDVKKCSNNIKT